MKDLGKNISIKYPVFNISYKKWDLEVLGDFFIYDDKYNGSEDFFEKYYKNQDFVDCNGNIFKLVIKVPVVSYFFLIKRTRNILSFQYTGEKIDLAQLKSLLIERSGQLDDEEAKKEIIAKVAYRNSIEELLVGL